MAVYVHSMDYFTLAATVLYLHGCLCASRSSGGPGQGRKCVEANCKCCRFPRLGAHCCVLSIAGHYTPTSERSSLVTVSRWQLSRISGSLTSWVGNYSLQYSSMSVAVEYCL